MHPLAGKKSRFMHHEHSENSLDNFSPQIKMREPLYRNQPGAQPPMSMMHHYAPPSTIRRTAAPLIYGPSMGLHQQGGTFSWSSEAIQYRSRDTIPHSPSLYFQGARGSGHIPETSESFPSIQVGQNEEFKFEDLEDYY
jgi:hypothetical protein